MTPLARLAPTALAAALAAVLVGLRPAEAAPPPIIDRLAKESTTLFDMGMKRLRRLVLDAAVRISSPGTAANTPAPASRVWYRADTATIEILFQFRISGAPPTAQQCMETRRRAITDTFSIGRTIYTVNLSFGERVRRRLGLIFAHEPLESGKEVIAIGERLSELTFVEISYIDARGDIVQRCRDGAAAQPPQ